MSSPISRKVMFSKVCHSVHRGSLYDATSYLAAWSHVPLGGSLYLVLCSFRGGGLLPGGLCEGESLWRTSLWKFRYRRDTLWKGISVKEGLCERAVSVKGSPVERVSVKGVWVKGAWVSVKGGLCKGERVSMKVWSMWRGILHEGGASVRWRPNRDQPQIDI